MPSLLAKWNLRIFWNCRKHRLRPRAFEFGTFILWWVTITRYTKTENCYWVEIIEYVCQASLLLRKQLAELNKNPVEGFSAGLIDDDDIYRWEVYPLLVYENVNITFLDANTCFLQVLIIGPPDTLYEGGFFKCHLLFPREYPLKPPVLRFKH